jgi:hypothetical protein
VSKTALSSGRTKRPQSMPSPSNMGVETQVSFVVEYDDGRTARIRINGSALDKGDDAAALIAKTRQRAGHLPKGKIKSVRRDPAG